MQVPFERIGSGQSWRLAYQVMGKEGPIFNPTGIRYLPPDSMPEFAQSGFDPAAAAAGLAGVNLAISAGSLVLATQVARDVRRLHSKLDEMALGVHRIEAATQEILDRVRRIDTQVAENNLRHALKHLLEKACTEDQIDFTVLAQISNDIQRFADSLEGSLLLNFQVKLSTDVREMLRNILSVFSRTRFVVARHHNDFVGGDPGFTATIAEDDDYLRPIDSSINAAVMCHRIFARYRELEGAISSKMRENFTFCSDDDIAQFQGIFDRVFREPMIEIFGTHAALGWTIWNGLPDELFEDSDRSLPDTLRRVHEAVVAWLHGSDGGLLYKIAIEADAVTDGYNEIFWPNIPKSRENTVASINVSTAFSPDEMVAK